MSATLLRRVSGGRFRRGRTKQTVETLNERIADLVVERQRLRSLGASAALVERNRLDIARAQWELSHALIERYCPQPAHAAA